MVINFLLCKQIVEITLAMSALVKVNPIYNFVRRKASAREDNYPMSTASGGRVVILFKVHILFRCLHLVPNLLHGQ